MRRHTRLSRRGAAGFDGGARIGRWSRRSWATKLPSAKSPAPKYHRPRSSQAARERLSVAASDWRGATPDRSTRPTAAVAQNSRAANPEPSSPEAYRRLAFVSFERGGPGIRSAWTGRSRRERRGPHEQSALDFTATQMQRRRRRHARKSTPEQNRNGDVEADLHQARSMQLLHLPQSRRRQAARRA